MWSQLSTTCSNYTEVAQWGTPSCSRPQPAMDNGARDCRPIDWSRPPPSWSVPPELHVLHGANAACLQIARLVVPIGTRTRLHGYARPTHCLCGHSGYGTMRNYILGNYVRDRYNCRNLFLKVQSDDELRIGQLISHSTNDGSIANKELWMCCCI